MSSERGVFLRGGSLKKVQPIREMYQITAMKKELRKVSHRNYMLFVLGINTGLRVGDILRLRVRDVQKDHICLDEEKTDKERLFLINVQLRAEITSYIKNKQPDDLMIPGRYPGKPLTRQQAYNILQTAATKVGVERIGTHTMRKTFGYWHYKRYKDVALLQRIFNHSSPSITLRYIGIEQDEIDESTNQFFL